MKVNNYSSNAFAPYLISKPLFDPVQKPLLTILTTKEGNTLYVKQINSQFCKVAKTVDYKTKAQACSRRFADMRQATR